jgi:hypothetical protein
MTIMTRLDFRECENKFDNTTLNPHDDLYLIQEQANLLQAIPDRNEMNSIIIVRLFTSLMLAAISITILAVTAVLISWQSSNETNFDLVIQTPINKFAFFPLFLQEGSLWILIAAGCGGVLDSILVIFGTLRRRPLWGLKVCHFTFDLLLLSVKHQGILDLI